MTGGHGRGYTLYYRGSPGNYCFRVVGVNSGGDAIGWFTS